LNLVVIQINLSFYQNFLVKRSDLGKEYISEVKKNLLINFRGAEDGEVTKKIRMFRDKKLLGFWCVMKTSNLRVQCRSRGTTDL